MDRLNETIRTYDKDVDRYIHKLEFDLPKEELEKFIGLLKGKKVLDAGCGAGRDSKYLSEKGLDVIGIDLSKNMIKAAKERAKAEFHVGDIRNTNFGDASFNG
ncbi:MAG: methyltransferase domain-containing protein, partial [Nanoarchaeota archaeon]|nr:methyltransferase domain-containing protein [Nanoarchaeota archaeon]